MLEGRIWAVSWENNTAHELPSLPSDLSQWDRFKLCGASSTSSMAIPANDRCSELICIDTGSQGGVCFSFDAWEEWVKKQHDPPMTLELSWSPGQGGWAISKKTWANELRAGPLRIPRTTVAATTILTPDISALLGLEALRHFDMMIDRRENALYLKPRQSDERKIRYNRLGAHFLPSVDDNVPMVAKVIPDSPGYRAGLRDGDTLVSVDRLEASDQQPGRAVSALRPRYRLPIGLRYAELKHFFRYRHVDNWLIGCRLFDTETTNCSLQINSSHQEILFVDPD